jgi:hypothetical protein
MTPIAIRHTILSAFVVPSDDVPVNVQKNIIGAPAGCPGTNESVTLVGFNKTNPAWVDADIRDAYATQCAADGDVVEWAKNDAPPVVEAVAEPVAPAP